MISQNTGLGFDECDSIYTIDLNLIVLKQEKLVTNGIVWKMTGSEKVVNVWFDVESLSW